MSKMKIAAAVCSLSWLLGFAGCTTGEDAWIPVGDETDSGSGTTEASDSLLGSSEAAAQSESGADCIYVYVCGAVHQPGVVCLQKGARAEQALEAAGGLREDAAAEYVNLAARLTDGEKLFFPTKEELLGQNVVSNLQTEQSTGRVNLNTADENTLCTLPGIGPAKAKDIIEYRDKNGPFKKPSDIMKVPGIKSGLFESIRDSISTE